MGLEESWGGDGWSDEARDAPEPGSGDGSGAGGEEVVDRPAEPGAVEPPQPAEAAAGMEVVTDDPAPTDEAPADETAPEEEAAPAQDASVEREAKFTVAEISDLDGLYRLDELPGGFGLIAGGLALLTDAYYDTPDFALLRHGYVLRLRHADGQTKVTLKGLERAGFGPIHKRFEAEGAVTSGAPLRPDGWPPAVRDRARPILGPAPELVPICFLEHARHLREVRRPGEQGSEPVGELGVEKVTVMAPDRLAVRHGAPELVATFAEVELELAPAASDVDADDVGEALSQLPGLAASEESKFERALSLVAGHPLGYAPNVYGVQPEMPMAEAGRLVLRQQLALMLLNEAGSRRGADIEHVHDMRVASRRARAAIGVFGPYFADDALKPIGKGLKRTGRALGAVRDLDVALYKLARHQKGLEPYEARGLDVLAARWHDRREDAYEELLRWLDSRAYARFIAGFELFCQRAGEGARRRAANGFAGAVEFRHVMPVAIVERFAVVRSHETLLSGPTRPAEADLHSLRIDCKRLRYSLEFSRHLLGDEGEALIKQLKRLQDHLGDLNDAAVTRDRLREMQSDGVDHPAVERYAVRQEVAVDELRDTFGEVWEPFIAHGNRRLLLEAVARL